MSFVNSRRRSCQVSVVSYTDQHFQIFVVELGGQELTVAK
jgi:hypothetical protein